MLAFDADQEYYANQYLQIAKEHKLTLLGIETSVGGMFVGPAYTYISSFVYWLSAGDPLGMFWTTLVFASLQASLTYFLFTKLKNEKTGLLAGFLALTSASLWNKAFAPSLINLLYPVGLLFFYVLLRLKDGKKYFLYLGLLLALAIQIHFSLLFFFPIALIYMLWQKCIKKENLKELIKIAAIVLVSLSPLILFDLRHKFFILGNLGKFVIEKLFTPPSAASFSFVFSLYWLLKGLVELFAHIMVPNPHWSIYLFIFCVFIFYLARLRKDFIFCVVGMMFTFSFVLFFLYRGAVPDYYWYFLLPAYFFVVSDFLLVILKHKLLKYVVYLFLFVITWQNLQFMSTTLNHYNFRLKAEVAKYIKAERGGKKVKISYDTDLGLGFGFDYLLKYEGVNIDNSDFEETYHIVMRNYTTSAGKEFREPGSPVSIKVVKLVKVH